MEEALNLSSGRLLDDDDDDDDDVDDVDDDKAPGSYVQRFYVKSRNIITQNPTIIN